MIKRRLFLDFDHRNKGEHLKKTQWILAFSLMVLTSLVLCAQKPEDLVGTWVGEATVEAEPDPNVLTLVLKLEDGKLAGLMTDQYNSMIEVPIQDITLQNGVFNFSVYADIGGGQLLLKFSMTLEGDSMKGKLDVPDMGMAGTWEASKQK